MFTTPPRPIDLTGVFPEFAPLGRQATRLHPRRGVVSDPSAGSVAGPMLWPRDEAWPTCGLGHLKMLPRPVTPADLERHRRARGHRLGSIARVERSLADPDLTAERRAGLEQLLQDLRSALERPEPTVVRSLREVPAEQPVPMVPVIQLRARDVPEIAFPAGTDIAQVLWCPYSHAEIPGLPGMASGPAPILRWRDSEQDLVAVAPTDDGPVEEGCILRTCVLHPEQITEYPDFDELPEQLRGKILAWHESFEAETGHSYRNDLCTAPGLKTGGWAYWPHEVRPPACACGAAMTLMLTITNGERGAQSWTPLEEQHVATLRAHDEPFYDPTGFFGVREQILVFTCSRDPRHDARFTIE